MTVILELMDTKPFARARQRHIIASSQSRPSAAGVSCAHYSALLGNCSIEKHSTSLASIILATLLSTTDIIYERSEISPSSRNLYRKAILSP